MEKETAEAQIKNTAILLQKTCKKVNGSNGWYQTVYIHQTISELELIKFQLDGIIRAIKTEFKKG